MYKLLDSCENKQLSLMTGKSKKEINLLKFIFLMKEKNVLKPKGMIGI